MQLHTEPIRAGMYAVWTNRYGREVMVRVLSVGPKQACVLRDEKFKAMLLRADVADYGVQGVTQGAPHVLKHGVRGVEPAYTLTAQGCLYGSVYEQYVLAEAAATV